VPAAPAATEATAAMAPGPASAPVAAGGPDPNSLNAYRIALARAARPYQRYPALASERGWAGTAEVRVMVARDGQAPQVLLAHSSGHELLDREALAMLARAAAATPLPDTLRGRVFGVTLPVVFDLAEAP